MGCLSCDHVYVGQTVRSFKARYDEHISDITHNRDGNPFRKFFSEGHNTEGCSGTPPFIGVTTSNPLRLNFGSIFSFWNLSKRKIELINTNLDMISTYCNVIRTMV
jgi:hypothetical protein